MFTGPAAGLQEPQMLPIVWVRPRCACHPCRRVLAHGLLAVRPAGSLEQARKSAHGYIAADIERTKQTVYAA